MGWGDTGVWAGGNWAEGGATVVALEAVEIGFGGAGRNVGLVNAGMWLAPGDVATRLGADYGERLLELLGNGPPEVEGLGTKHSIHCRFGRHGTTECAIGQTGPPQTGERCAQRGGAG